VKGDRIRAALQPDLESRQQIVTLIGISKTHRQMLFQMKPGTGAIKT
jgi:hypothetical protein